MCKKTMCTKRNTGFAGGRIQAHWAGSLNKFVAFAEHSFSFNAGSNCCTLVNDNFGPSLKDFPNRNQVFSTSRLTAKHPPASHKFSLIIHAKRILSQLLDAGAMLQRKRELFQHGMRDKDPSKGTGNKLYYKWGLSIGNVSWKASVFHVFSKIEEIQRAVEKVT